MGVSTDGILAYGYNIGGGEPWEIHEVEEWGSPDKVRLPWLQNDDEGYVTQFIEQCQARLMDMPWNTEDYFYIGQDDMLKKVGVSFKTYCSDEYQMSLLVAHAITVCRGDTTLIDFAALAKRAVDERWDEKLGAAVAQLGITPKQERPAWLLCSYWG